jgi:hypothetical protein
MLVATPFPYHLPDKIGGRGDVPVMPGRAIMHRSVRLETSLLPSTRTPRYDDASRNLSDN